MGIYYEDDFYDEPNEFEQQIEEFKKGLASCVKSEFIDEMDRLRKENAELQSVKENWEAIKSEYVKKQNQLHGEKSKLETTVRRERLSELMKDFQAIMYRAGTAYNEKPKCEKCDKNRKIYFLSPSGIKLSEDCECAHKESYFTPHVFDCCEFRVDRDNKKIDMWFKRNKDGGDEYYEFSQFGKTIYNKNMKFEDINDDETFFKDELDCKIYCDWLNSQTK